MDKREEFEMPKEKRSLLNAGHGPPIRQELPMAYGFYGNTAYAPTTSAYQRSATCSNFGSRELTSPGFYRYQPTFTNGPEITEEPFLVQKFQEKDQQLQKLSNELYLMRTSSDDLLRQNEELQRQFTATRFELESLRTKHSCDNAKYKHLTKLLTSLPDVPSRSPDSRASDDFIHLVASGDVPRGDIMTNGDLHWDDEAAMMKSVQCSEPSMEQVTVGKKETKEMEIASPIIQKKGGAVASSASSASFEVVGQGSCLGSPVEKEHIYKNLSKMPLHDMSMKSEMEAVRSDFDKISRKQEADKEELKRDFAELKEKVDQIISRMKEKENCKPLEVTSTDMQSEIVPTDRQSDDQRQNVSELKSSIWKLTEQKLELTREHEDLKKKELEWRAAVSNENKLQEELSREQRRVIDAEEQLETQCQHIQALEARIREMESSAQQGMAHSGFAGDLATENALLRHQIEAYKEDFEIERKDREKLVAQKDTLQRCYDTLRSDLDVARQQVKKYEDDITLLRIDNNTLRTRLRSVTEEVDALKEGRQFATSAPKACSPPAQNRTLVAKPMPQNTFAQQKPSPPPSGQSGDWECQACTYKNPAPRTFCEMCGTHEPLRMSSSAAAAQVPNCAYVPNIPVSELAPGLSNATHSTAPLLSNLRNYGDIETD